MAIMSTTGFLSMWLCNMATTAIMLPIVEAILIELIKDKRSRLQNTNLDEIIIPCNQLMIPDSCTKGRQKNNFDSCFLYLFIISYIYMFQNRMN